MVTNRETNKIYFSDLLYTENRFTASFKKLCSILKKYNIDHGVIKSTKDIWCRDYMPIQIDQDRFVQFRYEPTYLKDDLHLQSDTRGICKANCIQTSFSEINLDGGNLVNWSDRAIITDRVFDENHEYTSTTKLVSDIEKLLEAEVIIIPQIKSDMTGHADGLVRFYDRTTLIGNCLADEYSYWRKGMKKVLADYNLTYIDLPFMDYKTKDHPESAIGCYVNYLEVGNLIVVLVFEVNGNRDEEVVNILSEAFADRVIETINLNDVAKLGGLLNCITWNIKTKQI